MTHSIATPDPFDPVDSILAQFHQSWDGTDGSLVECWRQHQSAHTITLLSLLIKLDMQLNFKQGHRPCARHYFDLFPELVADDDRALSLVYEEFCLLEENDAQPSVSEFCERYQPWRDSLVSQLGYHRNLSQIAGLARKRVKYPVVGDRFATYQLRSVLGKGGAAQVYLARDDLGGREVVLKVSSSIGLEPNILASVKHRNIIPILTVAESPELELSGICMPYLPGQTLEFILEAISKDQLPRKAAALWEFLHLSDLDPELLDPGWKGFPKTGTYTEGVAWLGVAICNALAHIHGREIYHRDIKPANILLAYQEGPLLFDFNLARAPNTPEYAQAALNGGTLPYMAPEHLRAFLDPSVWDQVGAAADIYAFGLVLRELVTGFKPELPDPTLPLTRAIQHLLDRRHDLAQSTRRLRPDLPASLDAIISKALAFAPADRYKSAHDLGKDLRRFLSRQTLVVADSHCRAETCVNWIYRHRKSLGLVACMVVAGGTLLLSTSTQTKPLPPQAVVSNRRFDPQTSADFQTAKKLLHSKSIPNQEEARVIFDRLRRQYPRSAWPTYYLGFSEEKLGAKENALKLLQAALVLDDADRVIAEQLQERSPSITGLVVIGGYYRSHHDLDQACKTLEKVNTLTKGRHEGAYALLAVVQLQLNRTRDGIASYTKAIRIASERKDPKHDLLQQLPPILTPLLIDELWKALAPPPGQIDTKFATELVDNLDNQLHRVETLWASQIQANPQSQMASLLELYRGASAMDRGYLEFAQQRQEQVLQLFQNAYGHFATAKKMILSIRVPMPDQQLAEIKALRLQINEYQTELDRRVLSCGMVNSLPSF